MLLTVDIEIVAPPAEALFVNVAVQVLKLLGPMLVGLQATEETSTAALKLMVAVAELVPSVAVRVAD
jgi:hypothetical protein